MVRSIRWRLQIWYAVILLAVIGGFAGLLYYQVRSARLRQIDGQLVGAIRYLDANLRRFRPVTLTGPEGAAPPPTPAPEPGSEETPDRPPGFYPPGPVASPQRLMADLELPRNFRLAADDGGDERYFVIWRADGSVLKSSPQAAIDAAAMVHSVTPNPQWFQRGDRREVTMLGPWHTRIVVGQPLGRERAELNTFAWQLVGSGAAVFVVGMLGGWLISRRVVRPIARIARTAASISATNLSDRIDTRNIDSELIELADVLNAMFARLGAEFERQARFTADASHELRTPLAVLHANVELALNRPRSEAEYQETLETCLQASGRMRVLVDGLLTLARADAGRLELNLVPVDVRNLVQEAIDHQADHAEQSQIAIRCEIPNEPVVVRADPTFLARVLANLLSNALRYTPAGGDVCIRVEAGAEQAVISVTDTGCGIAEPDQPHIFERFYRADQARSRDSGGYGLGLAICKSLVEAHGGTIRATSQPGQGSTFIVGLPLAGKDEDAVGLAEKLRAEK